MKFFSVIFIVISLLPGCSKIYEKKGTKICNEVMNIVNANLKLNVHIDYCMYFYSKKAEGFVYYFEMRQKSYLSDISQRAGYICGLIGSVGFLDEDKLGSRTKYIVVEYDQGAIGKEILVFDMKDIRECNKGHTLEDIGELCDCYTNAFVYAE